jgi:hypothetical protein
MPSLLSPYLRIHLDNAFAEDWARQRHTAEDILQRLWSPLQPLEGVVLADQVGMGKTFVALAVAATTILGDPENWPGRRLRTGERGGEVGQRVKKFAEFAR